MQEVDEILARIDHDNIQTIRNDIAVLLRNSLVRSRDQIGYWEKVQFANAIGVFASNVRLPHASTWWLRLCLINLEKAYVPRDQRNEDYAPRENEVERLTFDELLAALDAVWPQR